jgi:hypothetical protein
MYLENWVLLGAIPVQINTSGASNKWRQLAVPPVLLTPHQERHNIACEVNRSIPGLTWGFILL